MADTVQVMVPQRHSMTAPGDDARLRELLSGTAVVRALTWMWALATASIDARSGVLDRRVAAFAVLGLMGVWTVGAAWIARRDPGRAAHPVVVVADVVAAAAVGATDWFVYDGVHAASFGSAWPLAAVVSAGVCCGWRWGLVAGVVVGSGGAVGATVVGRLEGRAMGLVGTIVLLGVAGAVSGWLAERLQRAESEVALVRAREQVATTLHDGVLQTLAVIQRRSGDTELVGLARDQERELRSFLSSGGPGRSVDVEVDVSAVATVRDAAGRVERRHRVLVEVVVIDDATLEPEVASALGGAVGEALTNAAKHAEASRITASIDVEGSAVVVAVVDDGVGFEADRTAGGMGLEGSVRRRLAEVGGEATVRSRPGVGSEVLLRIPVDGARR